MECFSIEHHKWLLSEEVDLLPSLLLPLAGPEQFEEEDMEKLPVDLQYLPDDKTREPDPDIRKMLLEALLKVDNMLCSKLWTVHSKRRMLLNTIYPRKQGHLFVSEQMYPFPNSRK